jgi:hypothetical protein
MVLRTWYYGILCNRLARGGPTHPGEKWSNREWYLGYGIGVMAYG